jgi:hypothetical protein
MRDHQFGGRERARSLYEHREEMRAPLAARCRVRPCRGRPCRDRGWIPLPAARPGPVFSAG